MAAWEYKTLAREIREQDGFWYWLDNNQRSDSNIVNDRLNELGAQGWELVDVLPRSTYTGVVKDWGMSNGFTSRIEYIFKRPR